jgi:2-phosphosulfolactate phosphatase
VRIHVAFTPKESVAAPVGVVVDVLRATSTIAQALAAGYPRVLCCAEIDEARALRESLGEGLLGGERDAVRVAGFDVGASPREFLEGRDQPLILSTTNGTRAILAAASSCGEVVLAGLLNLDAVVRLVLARAQDTVVLCAGFKGGFALDDAYCAGRIVRLVDADRTDAAAAAVLVADAFPRALDGLNARTYGPPGLEEDIAFCARENVLGVVPRFSRMVGTSAEIVGSGS